MADVLSLKVFEINFAYHCIDLILAHDCREPIVKDHQDTHKWDAFILSHGLKATCENVDKLHQRRIPKSLDDKRYRCVQHLMQVHFV